MIQVTLRRYLNEAIGDHATTTDRTWAEESGTEGYKPVRWEARVLLPEPGESAPPDMVPLHRWYSPSRNDHFTTADPDWHGGPRQRRDPDYRWRSLEGYVFDRPRAGTVPLYLWKGSGKHVLTTEWTWAGPERVRPLPRRRRTPDSRFDRIEGYAYPSGNITSEVHPEVLGYGSQRPQSSINLLGIIVDLADRPADVDDTDVDRLLFGRRYGGVKRGLAPLQTWHSAVRADFFTTTNPDWASTTAAFPRRDPDYTFFRTDGFGTDPTTVPAPAGMVMLRRLTDVKTGSIRVVGAAQVPVTGPGSSGSRSRTTTVNLAYVFDPSKSKPDGTVELHRWYSSSRKDHFTTTDPAWRGRSGATKAGYVWQALEGYVFPLWYPGSVPLCAWWSSSLARHDIQTTGPGSVSHRAPDYAHLRTEGQIFSNRLGRAPASGKPLWTWWNIEHGGHLTTSHPDWEGQRGDEKDGYRFVALEGWVLARARTGTLPLRRYVSPDGRRHLTTADPRMFLRLGLPQWTQEHFEGHVVGPTTGPDDLPAQFRNISNNQFRIRRAGLIRVRVPWTVAELRQAETLTGDERDDAGDRFAADVVTAARPGGFNYRTLATDGVVQPDDLTIVAVVPTYTPKTALGSYQGPRDIPGLPHIRAEYLAVNEFGGINLIAHELFHSLGFQQHLYGPGFALNNGATLFAGTDRAPGPGAYQLDPWHRMKAGWLKPEVVQMNHPGDNALLARNLSGVLAFWHPGRRPRLELFFVEFRAPGTAAPHGSTAASAGPGS